MIPAVAFCVLFLLLVVFTFATEREDKLALEEKRCWRLRHTPEGLRYEEKRDGAWLLGVCVPREDIEPGNWFYRFPTADEWSVAEEWARSRQQEVLARVSAEHPFVGKRHA